MRFRECCFILFACWLVFASAGCAATGSSSAAGYGLLPVTVLQAGRQCATSGNAWRATWIASPDALREWVAACRSNVIRPRQDDVLAVDFSRFGVLAVEMGRRSSAGYGFDTAGVQGRVAGRVATVTVDCYRPDPGAITAQVITSPWILIQMPMGGYDGIRVVEKKDARLLIEIGRP